MKHVDDVFERLNKDFGQELFDITRQSDEMSQDEAEQVMEDFTEKVGSTFGD